MKNFTTALIIACSFSALMFSSCRKEKADVIPSAAEYLSGKWRATHFAYDNNYNGVQDTLEKYPPLYLIDYTFYPDGSGAIYTSHPHNPNENYLQYFDWNFQNDNKEIVVNLKIGVQFKKQIFKITRLNSKNLILEAREDRDSYEYIEWIYFDRIFQ